ncbi:MAG: zinc protease [Chitinophagaceae bacterium]|nr:zinc protease [Chitinophagaceae bacterium]
MLNRTTAPPIADAVDFKLELKPPSLFTLDNGVPVYTFNAGPQEVLQLEFVFYAGNWYEEQNVLAASTNFLLKNGTSKKSAYEINEDLEFYGAYFNRHCYNETATITLHCLNKYLADLMPLITEVITDAAFPEEEIATYKQNQKQRLQVNLQKCDFIANRLIDEHLFGFHHPYGRYSKMEDYDAIEREQLRKFYERFYTHGKCIIFAAGKLPADFDQLLNMHFGKLPFDQNSVQEVKYNIKPAEEKKYNIVNDSNGVQGAIRIGRPFFNRKHPDFPKAQVLNNIFGGYFGSRLMSNIREDKGYTYGIHSYIQNHLQLSAWMISTEAGRDVCEATIKEVYHEMQRLREEPVTEEELHLVKNYMIGTILGDLDGPFQVIARWKNYILNGLDSEYFYNSMNVIRNITAPEIQELAQQYLNPESFYELVVV